MGYIKPPPCVRVEGVHFREKQCTRAHTTLLVGVPYPDLTMQELACLECSEPFNPTSLHFRDCCYKIEAKVRPNPQVAVALPAEAKIGTWTPCKKNEDTTVALPRGVVRLQLLKSMIASKRNTFVLR